MDETTPKLVDEVSNDVDVGKLAAEHRSVGSGEFRSFPTDALSSMFKASAMKKSPTLSLLTTPMLNEYGGEARLMQQVINKLKAVEKRSNG